jgi:hypothetical protein
MRWWDAYGTKNQSDGPSHIVKAWPSIGGELQPVGRSRGIHLLCDYHRSISRRNIQNKECRWAKIITRLFSENPDRQDGCFLMNRTQGLSVIALPALLVDEIYHMHSMNRWKFSGQLNWISSISFSELTIRWGGAAPRLHESPRRRSGTN